MQEIIILLLTIPYMGIGFVGLLSQQMKLRYYTALTFHLLFLYTVCGSFLGQWLTFPLVLGSITIVYFGCHKNIWSVILSLTGYLITIFSNHILTIPLSFLGFSISDISGKYYFPFLICGIILNFTLLFLVRKLLSNPKLRFLQECPQKLQLVFLAQLLLCILLIAINFIYGETVEYPIEVLSYNGLLISAFTLFTLILFYLLYKILQENYELKLQQTEQELLKNYTQRMESFYEDFRIFRHDYKNILSTLSYYINQKDWTQLQHYFDEKILPSGNTLSSNNFTIGKLHAIEIPSIKSVLYAKLILALNKELSLTLELTDHLKTIYMNELDLSRILGIILDNAIEAASSTTEKLLSIAIVISENNIIFSFSNSCPPLEVPITQLYKKGYTTKENHDGLGLYSVRNLTETLDNVSYSAEYDGMFHQVLEICNFDISNDI